MKKVQNLVSSLRSESIRSTLSSSVLSYLGSSVYNLEPWESLIYNRIRNLVEVPILVCNRKKYTS